MTEFRQKGLGREGGLRGFKTFRMDCEMFVVLSYRVNPHTMCVDARVDTVSIWSRKGFDVQIQLSSKKSSCFSKSDIWDVRRLTYVDTLWAALTQH